MKEEEEEEEEEMEKVVTRFDNKKVSSSSEIRLGIEQVSIMVKALKPQVVNMVKLENIGSDHHQHYFSSLNIPTKPFLSLCNVVLQVLDKIGPTMAVLRQDVHQNMQRLEKLHESDPSLNSNLADIIKKEVNEGIARKGHTSSKAFVWLTRALDFTAALLRETVKEAGLSMEQVVEEAYIITLKPWHRWISSAAFRVALKLVPDHQTFIGILLAKDESYETLKEEIQTFVVLLVPLLEDIHSVLRFYGLDRIKSN